ncbi:F-box/LRR-repeat protein 16 [Hetaerina americana]|uniref:F-box/LRR-repeat protein 16 n=1 Tax=Hetaerina americana TaxID=62018 RepID=UPI003A7F444B
MSISAQGVVERASAELSKRINGLGLTRSKHRGGGGSENRGGGKGSGGGVPALGSGGGSVMERVTNVFCGGVGGGSGGGASGVSGGSGKGSVPEKPSRGAGGASQRVAQTVPNPATTGRPNGIVPQRTCPTTWVELIEDEEFLMHFFWYCYSTGEVRTMAQVCTRWRDLLYAHPPLWSNLMASLPGPGLRTTSPESRALVYRSIEQRAFDTLCLNNATDLEVADVVTMLRPARNIRCLVLNSCGFGDASLAALTTHLRSLEELRLRGCNGITGEGLGRSLNAKICRLSLADCAQIGDEAVGAVATLLPNLTEFELQAYHVTDAALTAFSGPRHRASLTSLKLHSCWEITNHGVLNIVHALPHLTCLSLSGCSKVSDEGIEAVAENLRRLLRLDLSWCPRITDAALECIACDLTHLQELTLDRCVHITDIGVGYISTLTSLSVLYLRWCSQVRDFGIQHLCSMRNLRVLSLAGCPLLTASGLSSLIQLRHLQELELTNCPGASQELFEYLREHLPACLVVE